MAVIGSTRSPRMAEAVLTLNLFCRTACSTIQNLQELSTAAGDIRSVRFMSNSLTAASRLKLTAKGYVGHLEHFQ
jgi:hypothetical protein